jgi:hypothetical protein
MTSDSSENGRTLARRFTEDLWDKGELPVADEIVATDFVDHDPVPGQRPAWMAIKRWSAHSARLSLTCGLKMRMS